MTDESLAARMVRALHQGLRESLPLASHLDCHRGSRPNPGQIDGAAVWSVPKPEAPMRQIELDIIESLKEMIEALKKAQKEQQERKAKEQEGMAAPSTSPAPAKAWPCRPNARHQRRAKRVRCMPLLGRNRSFLFNCGLNIV
jgi:hypothetical protein